MKKSYDLAATASMKIPGARVAILQGRWHSEHTDKMVDACAELLSAAECQEVIHHVLPGCYEIPLAAKKLAATGQFEAIVVFGAIVRGETDHYQVILDTCIRELGRVMYDFDTPIIMELLPVHAVEHLIARSVGKNNKGIEAAQAAIETILWHRQQAAFQTQR